MEPGKLQLKFGTALCIFRDEDHMRVFLEGYCVIRKGKICLHHGDKLHLFTELSEAYKKNLPKGVKIPAFTRYMVTKGGGSKSKKSINEETISDYAEQND